MSSCLYCILAGTIYATKATFTPGNFWMAGSSFSLRIFLSFLIFSETSSVIMILARFGPYGLFFKIDGALRKIWSLSASLTNLTCIGLGLGFLDCDPDSCCFWGLKDKGERCAFCIKISLTSGGSQENLR